MSFFWPLADTDLRSLEEIEMIEVKQGPYAGDSGQDAFFCQAAGNNLISV